MKTGLFAINIVFGVFLQPKVYNNYNEPTAYWHPGM